MQASLSVRNNKK